jgi:hypothetical protein
MELKHLALCACIIICATLGSIVASLTIDEQPKSNPVDVYVVDVSGTPCIVANRSNGVAITCNWSKTK